MKFRIGDRVHVRNGAARPPNWVTGDIGTVRCFYSETDGCLGVAFERHVGGHDLRNGKCPMGYGWYVDAVDLDLVEAAPPATDQFDMAWHCFCDQLSRTPSKRE